MGTWLVSFVALTAVLQAPQASLSGFVSDADSGRPLTGATVRLPDAQIGVVSAEGGVYVVRDVPAGPQHLTVSHLGYATRVVHALVPASGVLVIDVSLRADPIRLEGLEVRPSVPVAGVEPSRGHAFDREVSLAAMRGHPLLSEPDAMRVLMGGDVALDPEAPSGLNIRGGDAGHTAYALDGIPVLDPFHSAGLSSAWSPDALGHVALISAAPMLPDALSGVVVGTVRDPGDRVGAETSVSTTHGAITLYGPLHDLGYVLSFRSGFPGLPSSSSDPTYLRGESGDALLKLKMPWLGGALEALYYSSDNELTTGRLSGPGTGTVAGGGPLEWGARSVGLTWARAAPGLALELKAWSATSATTATWIGSGAPVVLDADRGDLGVQGSVRLARGATSRTLGIRTMRTSTSYAIDASSPGGGRRGRTSIAGPFAEQLTDLGSGLSARLGASLALGAGVHLSPSAELSWAPTDRWSWCLSVARSHQFVQSLRNPESVVGRILPADLSVAAGSGDVPVPRSDQMVMAAEWHPTAGLRVTAHGYIRSIDGLVLVAPASTGPFAADSFLTGTGHARGLSVEAAGTDSWLGWLATYGWQRVTRSTEASTYRPEHGATHRLGAGVVVYPSATWSLRVGALGETGRRGTSIVGPFEWEACNLRDGGCEFAGAPELDGELGGLSLPAYLRVDVGARKHWHVRVAGRSTVLGVSGTVTNVFGRRNVLTYVQDDPAGPAAVEMLPTGPLVVGLDWRF